MYDPTISTDAYFVHISYLSELWAVRDLEWGQAYFGIDLNEQTEDERRHAAILKALLVRNGASQLGDDLDFAFQNVMFRNTARIDLSRIPHRDVFLQMHNIMERRAVWIYRTYMRGGRDPEIKKVLTSLMEDEKGHTHDLDLSHEVTRTIHGTDQWLFGQHLRRYNGLNLLACTDFWTDYYNKRCLL